MVLPRSAALPLLPPTEERAGRLIERHDKKKKPLALIFTHAEIAPRIDAHRTVVIGAGALPAYYYEAESRSASKYRDYHI